MPLAGLAGLAGVKTPDAARNVPNPSPLNTHFSSLTTQNVLLFFCRKTHGSKLTTHCSKCSFVEKTHRSQLIAHNSKICRIGVICVPLLNGER